MKKNELDLRNSEIKHGLTCLKNYPSEEYHKLFASEIKYKSYEDKKDSVQDPKSATRLLDGLHYACQKEILESPLTLGHIKGIHFYLSRNLSDSSQEVCADLLKYPGEFRIPNFGVCANGHNKKRPQFTMQDRELDLIADDDDKRELFEDVRKVGATFSHAIQLLEPASEPNIFYPLGGRVKNLSNYASYRLLLDKIQSNNNNAYQPPGNSLFQDDDLVICGVHSEDIRNALDQVIYKYNCDITRVRKEYSNALINEEAYQEIKLKIIIETVRNVFYIHPFPDMNGRVCKVLLQSLLIRNGFPPVALKEYYIIPFCSKTKILNQLKAGIDQYEPHINPNAHEANVDIGIKRNDVLEMNGMHNKNFNPSTVSSFLQTIDVELQKYNHTNVQVEPANFSYPYYKMLGRKTLKLFAYPIYYTIHTVQDYQTLNHFNYSMIILLSSTVTAISFAFLSIFLVNAVLNINDIAALLQGYNPALSIVGLNVVVSILSFYLGAWLGTLISKYACEKKELANVVQQNRYGYAF